MKLDDGVAGAPLRSYNSKRNRIICGFPGDFPQRLKRFQAESGLPWTEIARRVGVDIETVRRWKEGRTRLNAQHLSALYSLAESLGLGRLLRVSALGSVQFLRGSHSASSSVAMSVHDLNGASAPAVTAGVLLPNPICGRK